ncbi:hypothetical protein [Arthrobacter sp. NPDC090010]|uniref:hypothetical protein n=1 Tax=Arthrobacter sp. NPDC090010 TaxID=3363942 RepID=UPI00381EB243
MQLVRRLLMTYAISVAIVIVTCLTLVWFAPEALASDAKFLLVLGLVYVGTGFGFCIRRVWRPLVSNASGAVAVGFAWFTAVMADFGSERSADTSITLIFGSLGFALAYVLLFRPMAEEVRREETESLLRRVVREELMSVTSAHRVVRVAQVEPAPPGTVIEYER